MEEFFKDIIGFEGRYQISNLGNVKCIRLTGFDNHYRKNKGHFILKPSKKRNGYLQVSLNGCDKIKYTSIHRLVAKAFIPNHENKSQVNHIDGNKLNNSVENLEWNTPLENTSHSIKTGLRNNNGELNHKALFEWDDIYDIRLIREKLKLSFSEIAKKYNVHTDTIRKIINGKHWKSNPTNI